MLFFWQKSYMIANFSHISKESQENLNTLKSELYFDGFRGGHDLQIRQSKRCYFYQICQDKSITSFKNKLNNKPFPRKSHTFVYVS